MDTCWGALPSCAPSVSGWLLDRIVLTRSQSLLGVWHKPTSLRAGQLPGSPVVPGVTHREKNAACAPGTSTWSSIVIESGGHRYVAWDAGELTRGLVELARHPLSSRLQELVKAWASLKLPTDVVVAKATPGHWTKQSEALALEAVRISSSYESGESRVITGAVLEWTQTASIRVLEDRGEGLLYSGDFGVTVLASLPTVCVIRTFGSPSSTDATPPSLIGPPDSEAVYPLSALVPLVPLWPAAKLAFQVQASVLASQKWLAEETAAAAVDPIETASQPPPAVYPATVDTEPALPPAISGLIPDGKSNGSTFVPGYGNFVLVPHLNQCRAVFVDRTIVVKSGLDVRMTMRDGSILVGPIAALEVNPHLRPYLEAVCEYEAWALCPIEYRDGVLTAAARTPDLGIDVDSLLLDLDTRLKLLKIHFAGNNPA